jgi:hypothetical protein
MLTCRDCGACVRFWKPGTVCPECGGSHLNRLTEERVRIELDALAYLHASKGEPSDAQRQQLANTMREEHRRAAAQDAHAEKKGTTTTRNIRAPSQGKLFP